LGKTPGTAQIKDLFDNLSKDVHDLHQVLIDKLWAKSAPSINIVPGMPDPKRNPKINPNPGHANHLPPKQLHQNWIWLPPSSTMSSFGK
jgi:hypothetical protein